MLFHECIHQNENGLPPKVYALFPNLTCVTNSMSSLACKRRTHKQNWKSINRDILHAASIFVIAFYFWINILTCFITYIFGKETSHLKQKSLVYQKKNEETLTLQSNEDILDTDCKSYPRQSNVISSFQWVTNSVSPVRTGASYMRTLLILDSELIALQLEMRWMIKSPTEVMLCILYILENAQSDQNTSCRCQKQTRGSRSWPFDRTKKNQKAGPR